MARKEPWILIWLVVLTSVFAPGQTARPVVSAVVNAGSYAAPPYDGIAPGSIATIFGEHLASATSIADSIPLPRQLAGTSVTVAGVSAPIFYVSPGQINFQVPSSALPASQYEVSAPLLVSTQAGTSDPVPVRIRLEAMGIFTQDSTGCGPGLIQNHSADGSVSTNGPANSAEPGGYISLYYTGMGPVSFFTPPDGQPAGSNPLERGRISVPDIGAPAHPVSAAGVLYVGRAPGLIGVDQITAQLPDDAPEGCAVPVSLRGTLYRSQPVTISIRRGGGSCTDEPLAQIGSLVVRQVAESGPLGSGLITNAMLEARFEQAPESHFRPLPFTRTPDGVCGCNLGLHPTGPECPNTGPKGLSAGELLFELPDAGRMTILPRSSSNDVRYEGSVSGQIRSGILRVTGLGETIGPFEAATSPSGADPDRKLTCARRDHSSRGTVSIELDWRDRRNVRSHARDAAQRAILRVCHDRREGFSYPSDASAQHSRWWYDPAATCQPR